MNLEDIPILGQVENKDKRIKELEKALKDTIRDAKKIINEQRSRNLSLVAALRWFLASRPEMRVRININKFDELAKSHNLVLHSYLDKQTDDIVFYIDDKGVKVNGGIQETDKGSEAAIDKGPKGNG